MSEWYHSRVPFASKMSSVARLGKLGRNPCEIARNAREATDGVGWVRYIWLQVQRIDLQGVPACLYRAAGGAAELVDVVPRQLDACAHQLVHRWRFCHGAWHVPSMPACIVPALRIAPPVTVISRLTHAAVVQGTVVGQQCMQLKGTS
jgi:hypothetical protein|eukprot:COSAG01_NODE_4505_length_4961_cov_5.384805_7_plen_148_part_00